MDESMPWRHVSTRSIPQAFPYQGSKRKLAPEILSLFPPGGSKRLIEPFAGSAAISVAARQFGLADGVVINDVNAPLMELWSLIIANPSEVVETYAYHWNAQLSDPRSYFARVRDEFNSDHDPHKLLYLLCRVVKAAVRYSQKTGDFNQSADHRRLGAKPSQIAQRVHSASRLMQGAVTSSESYEGLLLSANRDDLVYMDPPYQGTSDVPDHRYLKGLQREAFSATLYEAVRRDVSFIVSYDVVRDDNKYGEPLDPELGLLHRNVVVGSSSQATLLGRTELSIESLYLSPALVRRLGGRDHAVARLDVVPEDLPSLF